MNIVQKIYADGTIEDVNAKWTLQQMQEFVGGYIERTPANIAHRSLIVNEEGILMDLPVNFPASKLTKFGSILFGNALLVKS